MVFDKGTKKVLPRLAVCVKGPEWAAVQKDS
jgi:hypothetical protein